MFSIQMGPHHCEFPGCKDDMSCSVILTEDEYRRLPKDLQCWDTEEEFNKLSDPVRQEIEMFILSQKIGKIVCEEHKQESIRKSLH